MVVPIINNVYPVKKGMKAVYVKLAVLDISEKEIYVSYRQNVRMNYLMLIVNKNMIVANMVVWIIIQQDANNVQIIKNIHFALVVNYITLWRIIYVFVMLIIPEKCVKIVIQAIICIKNRTIINISVLKTIEINARYQHMIQFQKSAYNVHQVRQDNFVNIVLTTLQVIHVILQIMISFAHNMVVIMKLKINVTNVLQCIQVNIAHNVMVYHSLMRIIHNVQ